MKQIYQIVLIDERGNRDYHAAGDPTPGRGCNEFTSEDAAREAIIALGAPDAGRWAVVQFAERGGAA